MSRLYLVLKDLPGMIMVVHRLKCPYPAWKRMFRKLTCFSVNILVINVIACILSLCIRYSIVEIGFYRNEEITKGNGRMMVGYSLVEEDKRRNERVCFQVVYEKWR